MIKYYWLFGVEFFAIAKMFELTSDGEIMLVSFNEEAPSVVNFCDFEKIEEYFLEYFKVCAKSYVASEEISEEKYNELKKFLNIK